VVLVHVHFPFFCFILVLEVDLAFFEEVL